jgi:maltose alpha-D-glucosyltransferase/alpha-amylase
MSGRARLLDALQAARIPLAAYLQAQRWFAAKTRALRRVVLLDTIPLVRRPDTALCLVRAELAGADETYLLPLALAQDEAAAELRAREPGAVVAELAHGALLHDALSEPRVGDALLRLIRGRGRRRGEHGELRGAAVARAAIPVGLPPRLVGVEQSNSSLIFGDRLILKLCRKLVDGVSPELELGRFLAGRFPHTPALLGSLEYRQNEGEPVTLAILQRFVPNRGDAWAYTLGELRRFYGRVRAGRARPPSSPGGPLALAGTTPAPPVRALVGPRLLDAARLLGQRTGELHLALAAPTTDPAFAAEPLGAAGQRELHRSLTELAGEILALLRSALPSLAEAERAAASRLLARRADLRRRLAGLLRERVEVPRIRSHGDLHLGQVLHTGHDFVLIDFEGEPARPLAARRRKHSALRDVAGMLRSFHYAARTGLGELGGRASRSRRLERWADAWQSFAGAAYLEGYLAATATSGLVPEERAAVGLLLDTFLLEKALYEVSYELNHRPAWVGIPLAGLAAILDAGSRGPRRPR